MDLQNIFYLVAIIFLLLMIGMMVTVTYLLWKLERSVSNIKSSTVERVQHFFADGGTGIMSAAGISIATFLLRSIKNRINKRSS